MDTPRIDLNNLKYILRTQGGGCAELTITTQNMMGEDVTVALDSVETQTKTIPGTGSILFKLHWIGTYTITAGGKSYGSIDVAEMGAMYSTTINTDMATINITTTEDDLFGRAVTIKKDDVVVGTVTFSIAGVASFNVFDTGTYVISSVNLSGEEASAEVVVSELGSAVYDVELAFVKLVSWATGTEEEITAMLDAYYSNKISIDKIKSVWSVGDSRTVHLSDMVDIPTGVGHSPQDVEFVIIGIEHDELSNHVNSKTRACITIHMKDCLANAGRMHNTRDWGDSRYSQTLRRSWINDTFEKALPQYLQELIKPVVKLTTEGTSTNGIFNIAMSEERCFMISAWEYWGSDVPSDLSSYEDGVQYKFYYSNRGKYTGVNTAGDIVSYWWTRSGLNKTGTAQYACGGTLPLSRGIIDTMTLCGIAIAMAL